MGLIIFSAKVQKFRNFKFVLGLIHSNILCDLEIFAHDTQLFRNEYYLTKFWLNYWHLPGRRKFHMRYKYGLKWILEKKIVSFTVYYVIRSLSLIGRKEIIKYFHVTILVLMKNNVYPRKKAHRAKKEVAPPQSWTLLVRVWIKVPSWWNNKLQNYLYLLKFAPC